MPWAILVLMVRATSRCAAVIVNGQAQLLLVIAEALDGPARPPWPQGLGNSGCRA